MLEEQRKHKIQRQILEAKLAALQGCQIESLHFFGITPSQCAALIRQDADASELMLNHLIAHLRAAMPDLRAPTTSLGQELSRRGLSANYEDTLWLRSVCTEIVADAMARGLLDSALGV